MSSNALLWPSQGTKPEERLDKHKYLRLPSQGVGGAGAPPAGDPLLAIYPPIADTEFQFYKFYQVKKNQSRGIETNVPLVVVDSLGAGKIQSATFDDIRAFDSDGNPLPYDVEDADAAGEIIVWVNVATVKDLEFIQLTFGDVDAIDESDPGAVYDSNYIGVHHLSGNGLDSTSNNRDLTVVGTLMAAADYGFGLEFFGTVIDHLIRQPYTGFPSTALTIEFSIQTTDDQFGTVQYAVGNDLDETNEVNLFFPANSNMLVIIKNQSMSFAQSFNDGNFHKIMMTWRSSDGQLIFYVDGVIQASQTLAQGETLVDGGALVLAQEQDNLGNDFDPVQALDGILKEFKLSNIARSSDYAFTVANNQGNNDAFWFRTPILENGEDNFLVDDMGRNIVAVQS